MKRAFLLPVLAILSLVCLTACEGPHQLVWSPDGTMMALVAEDGLHLGDASGKLSPVVATGVGRIAWLPDSKRFIAAVSSPISTWTEAKRYLNANQQTNAIEMAGYLKKAMLANGTKGLDQDSTLKKTPSWTSTSALLYLKSTEPASVQKQFGEDGCKLLSIVTLDLHSLRSFEVTGGGANTGAELWHGFGDIANIAVAPDGKYALLVHRKEVESELADIDLLSLETAGPPIHVGETALPQVAWSADSKRMLFFHTSTALKDSSQRLGTLDSLQLRSDDGSAAKAVGTPEELLCVSVDGSSEICALKDGRIIFSSNDVELPATGNDLSGIQNLFAFTPGDHLARRLLSRTAAERFRSLDGTCISPSGKFAVARRDDTVGIFNLVTGAVSEFRADPVLDPSWRNDNEVSFATLVKTKGPNRHDAEVVLHSLSSNEDHAISQDWPNAAVDGFLIKKEDKQPQAAPSDKAPHATSTQSP